MELIGTKVNNYYVVEVKGKMDATTAHEFERQSNEWLASKEKDFIVDMSGVEYISSAGLRSILVAAKGARAAGGDIRFCGLSGIVEEVFRMSGFESMFRIFETRDEALRS